MELTDAQPANPKEKRAAEEPEISVAKESKTEENREHNEATTSGGEAEQRVEEIPIGTSLPETKRETHEEKLLKFQELWTVIYSLEELGPV